MLINGVDKAKTNRSGLGAGKRNDCVNREWWLQLRERNDFTCKLAAFAFEKMNTWVLFSKFDFTIILEVDSWYLFNSFFTSEFNLINCNRFGWMEKSIVWRLIDSRTPQSLSRYSPYGKQTHLRRNKNEIQCPGSSHLFSVLVIAILCAAIVWHVHPSLFFSARAHISDAPFCYVLIAHSQMKYFLFILPSITINTIILLFFGR